jgi:drug/metabolite transporter (DMT)-like permease
MSWGDGLLYPGVLAAMGAAALFGIGTPLAKLLFSSTSPWLLAGLLYIGSGLGLTAFRILSRAPSVRLARDETLWFAGAIFAGGIVGPVLLMLGLSGLPASNASLLLNAEGVFTALLAWFAFNENFDRRIALGMLAILVGASVLSWQADANLNHWWPSLAVLGACLAWGIDNNLNRKVSRTDAAWIASVKGLVAGTMNMGLAFILGAKLPAWPNIAGAMILGFLAYGVSLTLFVLALCHLGTARAGAYFSVAQFVGALLALVLGELRRCAVGWAKLLKRVFNLDLEHCPNCGGTLTIIAAIFERPAIEKILRHVGLDARPPPRSPARGQMTLQDF